MRRRWKRLLLLVGVFVLPPVALYFYMTWKGDRELRQAIAELDSAGAPWRWEQLMAARKQPPPDQDVRGLIFKVRGQIPNGFLAKPVLERALNRPGAMAISPEDAEEFDAAIGPVRDVLLEARKIAGMPQGRLHISWPADALWPNLDDLQKCREFLQLLHCAAAWHTHHGDLDAALEDCLAMQRSCQALADEWTAVAALVRIAMQAISIHSLERVLSQSHPTSAHAPALARLQQAWEQFDSDRGMQLAFAGERAGSHRIFEALATGQHSLSETLGVGSFGRGKPAPSWEGMLERLYFVNLKSAHAWTLRYLTEAVQIQEMPEAERDARWTQLDQEARKAPGIARLLAPALQKIYQAHQRGETLRRCAVVGLAAERFRIQERRWPKNLAELTPKYLANLPDDPFAAVPVRARTTGDGLVIYSVGPDGKHRGAFHEDQAAKTPSLRYEFRLWNLTQRRQSAQP